MTTILPPTDRAGRLCGMQKRKPGAVYRRTTNLLSVPCEEGDLLYQTLTGEVLLLAQDEIPDEDVLIAHWILVPTDYDEGEHLQSVRKILRMMTKKRGVTAFTILTTTDCNARCFYCYELSMARKNMSDETARATADYIARVCGGEPVRLHWFGGEPLYNRRAIEIITDRLRKLGVDYTSKMTTNGYYLDRATAAAAVGDWHLDRVQITLDGTRAVYNKTKAYINRDPDAFGRVLDNITACLEAGIRVQIRLNMDEKNADDLMDLADELGEHFAGRKGLSVYTAVLRPMAGPVHQFGTAGEETRRALALVQKLESLGLTAGSVLPGQEHGEDESAPGPTRMNRDIRLNRCMADNEGSDTILPDGTLVRCEECAGADATGNVFDGQRDAAVLRSWQETAEYPECRACPGRPLCLPLKKCPWNTGHCAASAKASKLHGLETALRMVYGAWKRDNR